MGGKTAKPAGKTAVGWRLFHRFYPRKRKWKSRVFGPFWWKIGPPGFHTALKLYSVTRREALDLGALVPFGIRRRHCVMREISEGNEMPPRVTRGKARDTRKTREREDGAPPLVSAGKLA